MKAVGPTQAVTLPTEYLIAAEAANGRASELVSFVILRSE